MFCCPQGQWAQVSWPSLAVEWTPVLSHHRGPMEGLLGPGALALRKLENWTASSCWGPAALQAQQLWGKVLATAWLCPTSLSAMALPQTSPRPGVRAMLPEHPARSPTARPRRRPHTRACPASAPYLQIQDAVYRDGEELAAALQAHDSLQGAVAKAERRSAGAPAPDRPNFNHNVLTADLGPSKVPWDSRLGQVFGGGGV